MKERTKETRVFESFRSRIARLRLTRNKLSSQLLSRGEGNCDTTKKNYWSRALQLGRQRTKNCRCCNRHKHQNHNRKLHFCLECSCSQWRMTNLHESLDWWQSFS